MPVNRQTQKAVRAYIQEKNLNFIVARGRCVNRRQDTLPPGELAAWIDEFSNCGFSRAAVSGDRPCPPFMAADLDEDTGRARVVFLIDFTREAESGRAGKFYSKIMGALSTHFFAACPDISELEFPFELEDAVGRGLRLFIRKPGISVIKGSG